MDSDSRQLTHFVGSLSLPAWRVDPQGRVVLANAAMEARLGVAASEMVGRPVSDFLTPRGDESQPWSDVRPDAASLRHPAVFRTDTPEAVGELHWVGDFSADGTLEGLTGLFVSGAATDPHASGSGTGGAEAALVESQTRFQDLFENSLDAICILDAEHNYLEVNRAAERLTGYSREELLQMNVADMVHPDDMERSAETFEDLERTGAYETYEGRILTKDGGTRYIEVNSNVIVRDGKVVGSRDILRDVTERKNAEAARRELEEQLFSAQKMESVGRLAGGVAHDFNNILASVMGYAELLREVFPDEETFEGEAASVILKGAERASHLTRQLLGFARRGKYIPVAIDVNTLVRDVIGMSEKIFEQRIEVVYDLAEDLPPVEADKNQLDQVLTNLVINARDAMPDGGRLYVGTEALRVSTEDEWVHTELAPGDYVRISITDTGTGMSGDVLDHIFEPFFTTKEGHGTGLGLATVYGIVKNHGGDVEVYSEPGVGSRFSVLLPAAPGVEVPEEGVGRIVHGSGLVLVIDDEPEVRGVVTRMLESLGYTVLQAANGAEGIDRFRRRRDEIDLVIIDMVMPGMDGGDTYRALRKLDPDVRTVLTSGFTQQGRAASILAQGMAGFIQKPVRLSELSRVVGDVLRREG